MNTKSPTYAASKATPSRGGATVTLEMVAKLAGVSPSTVSRILNSTAIVSGPKKQAVDEAIAKLGFVPNPMARGLAGGRTLSVGVLTQAIDSPFYGAALRGIEDALDPAGYSPLFVSGHWNADVEARCIDVLRSRRVDGIIVLTGRLPDQALRSCAKNLPIVVTGRSLKAPGLFALNFNNFEGGRLATQHLIDFGHRKIAFISGDLNHPDAKERLRGYRAAIENSNIEFRPEAVVCGDYSEIGGFNAVNSLLASGNKYTAIFASNDQMAYGASLGLQRRSIRVPEDMSVVGFDDLPTSLFANPPLSTIHQPAYELGQLAASSMLQLLAGIVPTAHLPAPVFISRESSRQFTG